MTAARDPITPLQDIVKKAEQIERLIQGMTQEEFLHDERTQLALGMAFIDLGNAHSQLSAENPEAAAMFAQLEDTVGFRNVLAHHYEEVPPATLWKIARDPLPEIGRAAVSMLAELDPEGRHTAADHDATERQRSDRELQLACALTSRALPSDGLHWSLASAIGRVLYSVDRAIDPPDREIEQRARAIAQARAESDLRVEVTRKLGGSPRHEFRARFDGNPRFDRRERIEAYDEAIRTGLDDLARRSPDPDGLERFVARAVLVAAPRDTAMARRMESALSLGKVPEAKDIRIERKALLTELSEPIHTKRLSLQATDRLLERVYSSFTAVETRRICAGSGPSLEALTEPSSFPTVVESFRALHAREQSGPAPWHKLHAEVSRTLPSGRDRAAPFPMATPTEERDPTQAAAMGTEVAAAREREPETTAPDPRLADDVLVLSCAVSERVDASAPVHRSTLPRDVETVLRDSMLARDVPEAEVEEIAFGIARKRAETDLRVATTRKVDSNEYNAAKARFEGNPQFYMKQHIDAYKAAIAKGMRRLHSEEPVPARIELDVARAVVAMHGTERQELAGAMAEALERGTTAAADDIRKERQAVLGALREGAAPRDEIQEGALLRRVYGNFTASEVREICEGRGPHLARLPDDAARVRVREGMLHLHRETGSADPFPWRARHAAVARAFGARQEGPEHGRYRGIGAEM